MKLILLHFSTDVVYGDIDFSCNRPGQDVRYALDDSKIQSLGWSPKKLFIREISSIVDYYKNKFIW
jgi:dTDP-D-glucose 4,6-dehydratase